MAETAPTSDHHWPLIQVRTLSLRWRQVPSSIYILEWWLKSIWILPWRISGLTRRGHRTRNLSLGSFHWQPTILLVQPPKGKTISNKQAIANTLPLKLRPKPPKREMTPVWTTIRLSGASATLGTSIRHSTQPNSIVINLRTTRGKARGTQDLWARA